MTPTADIEKVNWGLALYNLYENDELDLDKLDDYDIEAINAYAKFSEVHKPDIGPPPPAPEPRQKGVPPSPMLAMTRALQVAPVMPGTEMVGTIAGEVVAPALQGIGGAVPSIAGTVATGIMGRPEKPSEKAWRDQMWELEDELNLTTDPARRAVLKSLMAKSEKAGREAGLVLEPGTPSQTLLDRGEEVVGVARPAGETLEQTGEMAHHQFIATEPSVVAQFAYGLGEFMPYYGAAKFLGGKALGARSVGRLEQIYPKLAKLGETGNLRQRVLGNIAKTLPRAAEKGFRFSMVAEPTGITKNITGPLDDMLYFMLFEGIGAGIGGAWSVPLEGSQLKASRIAISRLAKERTENRANMERLALTPDEQVQPDLFVDRKARLGKYDALVDDTIKETQAKLDEGLTPPELVEVIETADSALVAIERAEPGIDLKPERARLEAMAEMAEPAREITVRVFDERMDQTATVKLEGEGVGILWNKEQPIRYTRDGKLLMEDGTEVPEPYAKFLRDELEAQVEWAVTERKIGEGLAYEREPLVEGERGEPITKIQEQLEPRVAREGLEAEKEARKETLGEAEAERIEGEMRVGRGEIGRTTEVTEPNIVPVVKEAKAVAPEIPAELQQRKRFWYKNQLWHWNPKYRELYAVAAIKDTKTNARWRGDIYGGKKPWKYDLSSKKNAKAWVEEQFKETYEEADAKTYRMYERELERKKLETEEKEAAQKEEKRLAAEAKVTKRGEYERKQAEEYEKTPYDKEDLQGLLKDVERKLREARKDKKISQNDAKVVRDWLRIAREALINNDTKKAARALNIIGTEKGTVEVLRKAGAKEKPFTEAAYAKLRTTAGLAEPPISKTGKHGGFRTKEEFRRELDHEAIIWEDRGRLALKFAKKSWDKQLDPVIQLWEAMRDIPKGKAYTEGKVDITYFSQFHGIRDSFGDAAANRLDNLHRLYKIPQSSRVALRAKGDVVEVIKPLLDYKKKKEPGYVKQADLYMDEFNAAVHSLNLAQGKQAGETRFPENAKPMLERFGVDLERNSPAEIEGAVRERLATMPLVRDMVRRYEYMSRNLAKQLLDAGIFEDPAILDKPYYLHHEVVDYAERRGGSAMLRSRLGTERDIELDVTKLMAQTSGWAHKVMDAQRYRKMMGTWYDALDPRSRYYSGRLVPHETGQEWLDFLDNVRAEIVRKQEAIELGKNTSIWGSIYDFKDPRTGKVHRYIVDSTEVRSNELGLTDRKGLESAFNITEVAKKGEPLNLDKLANFNRAASITLDNLLADTRTISRGGRFILVPEPVHKYFNRVDVPDATIPVMEAFARIMRTWKFNILPIVSGPGYMFRNLGDQMLMAHTTGHYRAWKSPMQIRNWAPVMQRLAQRRGVDVTKARGVGPYIRRAIEYSEDLFSAAEKQQILDLGGTAIGEVMLQKDIAEIGAMSILSPRHSFYTIAALMENSRRFANFTETFNMIQSGKLVPLNHWGRKSLEGLTVKEQAAQIVLMETVDYAKLTRFQRVSRDIVAPFSTWAMSQLMTFPRRGAALFGRDAPPGQKAPMIKKAATGWAATLTPLLLAQMWNVGKYPEIEKNLPLWVASQLHIITGFKYPNGNPVVMVFPLPVNMFMDLIGMGGVTGILPKWYASYVDAKRRGKPEEARTLQSVIREYGMDNWNTDRFTAEGLFTPSGPQPKAAKRAWMSQAGLAITGASGFTTGIDPKTGGQIVPYEWQGSPKYEAAAMRNWLLGVSVPVMANYYRAIDEGEVLSEPGAKAFPTDARSFIEAVVGSYMPEKIFGMRDIDLRRSVINNAYAAKRGGERKKKTMLADWEVDAAKYGAAVNLHGVDSVEAQDAYDGMMKTQERIMYPGSPVVPDSIVNRRKSPSYTYRLWAEIYKQIPKDKSNAAAALHAEKRMIAARFLYDVKNSNPTISSRADWEAAMDKQDPKWRETLVAALDEVYEMLGEVVAIAEDDVESAKAAHSSQYTGAHLEPYLEEAGYAD